MTALYIILGIIIFFVLVFSVKISVELIHEKDFSVTLKILFLKIPLVPAKEKKKTKKEKKPKQEKPKEEKPKEEKPKEKGPKKENFVTKFYNNQGFDGTMMFLQDVLGVLNTFMGDIFRRSFVIERLFLTMRVSKGDAAETAIAYGKTCTAVFPAVAHICATMKVRKYDIDISPDYLANKSTSAIHTRISVRPIRITNAAVKLAFRAVIAYVKADRRGKERMKRLAKQKLNINSGPVKDTEERNTL